MNNKLVKTIAVLGLSLASVTTPVMAIEIPAHEIVDINIPDGDYYIFSQENVEFGMTSEGRQYFVEMFHPITFDYVQYVPIKNVFFNLGYHDEDLHWNNNTKVLTCNGYQIPATKMFKNQALIKVDEIQKYFNLGNVTVEKTDNFRNVKITFVH